VATALCAAVLLSIVSSGGGFTSLAYLPAACRLHYTRQRGMMQPHRPHRHTDSCADQNGELWCILGAIFLQFSWLLYTQKAVLMNA